MKLNYNTFSLPLACLLSTKFNKTIQMILLVFFIGSSSLCAQSIHFDEGQNGFSLFGQLASNNGSTLVGITPGYTFNGKLSLNLGVGSESFDGLNMSSTAIISNISYLVLKQDDHNNPVSVQIGSSYQYNTFSNVDNLNYGTSSLYAAVYHEINTSSDIRVIPGAAVGYSRSRVNFENVNLGSVSAVTYGLNVSVNINDFIIQPALLFRDGNSVFHLQLGYVFN